MTNQPSTDDPLLKVVDLKKSYDHVEVLKSVDFEIHKGQVKAVLGPSGSGKSTMLRLMALLEHADGGEIYLEGRRIGVKHVHGRYLPERETVLARERREIGMVFQRFNLFPHLTACENVMIGPVTVKGAARSETRERALALLDRVGLSHRAEAYPSELSGGQQQRVAIARAMIMNPAVLLFDEPTSALDPELVGEVLDVMEGLAADGMTMIVVTHEVRFARHVADEVTLFDGGVLVESASPDEFFDNPQHERTKSFLRHVQ